MNPPEFSGSKVEEDPNGFIYEVYKILAIMGTNGKSEYTIEVLEDMLLAYVLEFLGGFELDLEFGGLDLDRS
ncbi:hypothetical protein MTR67_002299 [Solanum verrucosum]|uniref:Uncharacterized protein n=1 Tax=Solanum verrucosum TaxID=315347 RepID=A0AAF0PVX9_SOLVR|nr:hypothetical protein MTR67_002299 [Solanum verrucosum]